MAQTLDTCFSTVAKLLCESLCILEELQTPMRITTPASRFLHATFLARYATLFARYATLLARYDTLLARYDTLLARYVTLLTRFLHAYTFLTRFGLK